MFSLLFQLNGDLVLVLVKPQKDKCLIFQEGPEFTQECNLDLINAIPYYAYIIIFFSSFFG